MATRLATPRNFITVTPVSSTNASATPSASTTTDVQTTQITSVTLHHVLQQVSFVFKISLQYSFTENRKFSLSKL